MSSGALFASPGHRLDTRSGREGRSGLTRQASEGLALRLTSMDSLNWSHPDKQYRVRLHVSPLPAHLKGVDRVRAVVERRRSLGGLLGSKTKGKRFHGYLAGDYAMATHGFYTNNLNGLNRLFAKYPELFDTVQSLELYKVSLELAASLAVNEHHFPS